MRLGKPLVCSSRSRQKRACLEHTKKNPARPLELTELVDGGGQPLADAGGQGARHECGEVQCDPKMQGMCVGGVQGDGRGSKREEENASCWGGGEVRG